MTTMDYGRRWQPGPLNVRHGGNQQAHIRPPYKPQGHFHSVTGTRVQDAGNKSMNVRHHQEYYTPRSHNNAVPPRKQRPEAPVDDMIKAIDRALSSTVSETRREMQTERAHEIAPLAVNRSRSPAPGPAPASPIQYRRLAAPLPPLPNDQNEVGGGRHHKRRPRVTPLQINTGFVKPLRPIHNHQGQHHIQRVPVLAPVSQRPVQRDPNALGIYGPGQPGPPPMQRGPPNHLLGRNPHLAPKTPLESPTLGHVPAPRETPIEPIPPLFSPASCVSDSHPEPSPKPHIKPLSPRNYAEEYRNRQFNNSSPEDRYGARKETADDSDASSVYSGRDWEDVLSLFERPNRVSTYSDCVTNPSSLDEDEDHPPPASGSPLLFGDSTKSIAIVLNVESCVELRQEETNKEVTLLTPPEPQPTKALTSCRIDSITDFDFPIFVPGDESDDDNSPAELHSEPVSPPSGHPSSLKRDPLSISRESMRQEWMSGNPLKVDLHSRAVSPVPTTSNSIVPGADFSTRPQTPQPEQTSPGLGKRWRSR